MIILIVPVRLSDGSEALDVVLQQGESRILLPAIDTQHATRLREVIQSAVAAHTTEDIY